MGFNMMYVELIGIEWDIMGHMTVYLWLFHIFLWDAQERE